MPIKFNLLFSVIIRVPIISIILCIFIFYHKLQIIRKLQCNTDLVSYCVWVLTFLKRISLILFIISQ